MIHLGMQAVQPCDLGAFASTLHIEFVITYGAGVTCQALLERLLISV